MTEKRTYPMTSAALEQLRAELEHKYNVERPAMAERLKAAIEMGDLTENAEYISAKEDQAFLEGRIWELEEMIRGAVIIQESNGDKSGTVRLGCQVTVVEEGVSTPETFMIVGAVEANPIEGKISNESPLGRALIGRKVGDVVRVAAPDGEMVFEISDVT